VQKISIPTPWMVMGNSKGVGVGVSKAKHFKSMKLNWNFWRSGGIESNNPPWGRF